MPKFSFIPILSFLLIATGSLWSQIKEELIVFTQNSDSDFTKKTIDSLQKYTNERNIPIKVVVIAQGAPKEVSHTPCIVYQNHLGRSMYKGRLASFGRILGFVRTVRNAPLGLASQKNEAPLYVWQEGRARVLFEYKITEPKGEGATSVKNLEDFYKTAKEGISEGFSSIKEVSNSEIPTASWKFYLSFYPYIDAKGKMYISTEIYSGYDCVTPIYKRFEMPVSGNLRKLKKTFADAAQDLETVWHKLRKESTEGDALEPISSTVADKSWENSDLPLPPVPEKTIKQLPPLTNRQLAQKWVFAGSYDSGIPAAGFSFPEPLTQYTGEAREISGTLTLGSSNRLEGASGHFEVKTASVTMGLEALDEHLHKMFKVKEFPIASFDFDKLKINGNEALSDIMPFSLEAKFRFKSVEIEVPAVGQVELSVDEDGETPILIFNAGFELPELEKTFDLERPGSEKKANNRVIFRLNFIMKEKI